MTLHPTLSNPIGTETTMNNIRVASQTSHSLNPHNCNISFSNLHLTEKEFEDFISYSWTHPSLHLKTDTLINIISYQYNNIISYQYN